MIQYLCDLCGEPIGSKEGRLFKIKECKQLWWESYWEELLAHDECVKAVAAAARERAKNEEQL